MSLVKNPSDQVIHAENGGPAPRTDMLRIQEVVIETGPACMTAPRQPARYAGTPGRFLTNPIFQRCGDDPIGVSEKSD
jgi:hypothetical protein